LQGGLDQVLPLTELTSFIASELTTDRILAADTRKFDNSDIQTLIDRFPGQRLKLYNAIDECRWIKSKSEIEHMRYVTEIGSESINSMVIL
jgi:Xaa-Pro aminopeptidase